MAQADHLAGPSCVPGKRLITNAIIIAIAIVTPIVILAYLFIILELLNFTAPASLFVQFIAILTAFTIFLGAIESPFSIGGTVA